MIIADFNLLILPNYAAFNAPDGNTADIFIVINAAHQHLERRFLIHFRRWDILQNRFKQRLEVSADNVRGIAGCPLSAGTEQHRRIQLLIGGIQIHQQFKDLIDYIVNSLVRAVYFINNNNHSVPKLQCPAQDKSGLRHRTFRCIHQENNTIYHFEDTFHFPAEIGMTRGIHNIDFGVAVPDRRVFRHNGNPAFPFKVIGIHYTVNDFLILPVNPGLLQHFIYKRCFSVVYMGNNRYISKLIHKFSSLFFNISQRKRILTLEETKSNDYNRNVRKKGA